MLLISLFQYSFERLLRNIKKKFPVFLLFWRIPQRVFTSVFSSVIIVAYSSLALSFIVNFMFPGYFSCYLHCTLEVQTHEVLHFGHLCRIFFFFFFSTALLMRPHLSPDVYSCCCCTTSATDLRESFFTLVVFLTWLF